MPLRAAVLCCLLASLPVRADGAFPDSLKLLLAPDLPDQLVLATNFGLVISEDGGKSWHLHCEAELPSPSNLYERAAPPARTLFAPGTAGLGVSRDGACTWSVAGGIGGGTVYDAFPDPSHPDTVFAIAAQGPNGRMTLHRSTDGAATFGAPVLTAPADDVFFSGVEVASSDAQRVYVTANTGGSAGAALIFVSQDGGGTWDSHSLATSLGGRFIRLMAIDRSRPDRLYLRVRDPLGGGDAVGISDDGGKTARIAWQADTPLTSFLQRSDGTLWVGALIDGTLVSRDDGASFTPLAKAPHARAFAERGGFTYVAADNTSDGFALARTRDDQTWEVLLKFADICGPASCGAAADKCGAAWPGLAEQLAVPAGTCGRPARVTPPVMKPPSGCGCGAVEGCSALALLLGVATCRPRGGRSGRPSPAALSGP